MLVVVQTAAPAASPCAVHTHDMGLTMLAQPRAPRTLSSASRCVVTAHRSPVHTGHHNDQAPEPTQSKIDLSALGL
jgi:hypothetical protein